MTNSDYEKGLVWVRLNSCLRARLIAVNGERATYYVGGYYYYTHVGNIFDDYETCKRATRVCAT